MYGMFKCFMVSYKIRKTKKDFTGSRGDNEANVECIFFEAHAL